jgi:hypothetical protein
MLASAARAYLKNQDLQSEALLDLFLEFGFGIGLNIYCQQLQHLIEDMASASAGCLWEEHLDFMTRVKNHRRYLFDLGFVFPTTTINQTKLPA